MMDPTTIVLLVLIVVLVIAYPILVSTRNKKERQRYQEMSNSLKRGDKVLTSSGVYGTIVDLHMEEDKKIVTIETGMGKNKGYMAVDAYAIYTVFPDEKEQAEQQKTEEKTNAETEVQKSKKDEKKEEDK
ncbi:MAG: preprotein translocase subunit YajC [Clostridia bacterium]|nr:preprotein translocase subunit YajC [Clostridia bacterium]